MPDYSRSRSEYLKIMFGGKKEGISSLNPEQVNDVGGTSFDAASLSDEQVGNFLTQYKNSSVAGTDAYKSVEAEKEKRANDDEGKSWWENVSDFFGNISTSITEGIYNAVDSVWDAGMMLVGGLSGGFWGQSNGTTEWTQNAAKYDWVAQATTVTQKINELTSPISYLNPDKWKSEYWTNWGQSAKDARADLNENKNVFGNSDVNNFVYGIGTTIGELLPSLALAIATGGSSAGASIGKKIAGVAVQAGYAGLSAAGSGFSQASNEGASFQSASAYGGLKGGISAVVTGVTYGIGATATSNSTSGVADKLGGKVADATVKNKLASGLSQKAAEQAGALTGTITSMATKAGIDGTRQAAMVLSDPLVKQITYDDDALNKAYGSNEKAMETFKNAGIAFAQGAITSGIITTAKETGKYVSLGGKEGYTASYWNDRMHTVLSESGKIIKKMAKGGLSEKEQSSLLARLDKNVKMANQYKESAINQAKAMYDSVDYESVHSKSSAKGSDFVSVDGEKVVADKVFTNAQKSLMSRIIQGSNATDMVTSMNNSAKNNSWSFNSETGKYETSMNGRIMIEAKKGSNEISIKSSGDPTGPSVPVKKQGQSLILSPKNIGEVKTSLSLISSGKLPSVFGKMELPLGGKYSGKKITFSGKDITAEEAKSLSSAKESDITKIDDTYSYIKLTDKNKYVIIGKDGGKIFDVSKAKIGANGKIVEDGNTEPLFGMAKTLFAKAKQEFGVTKEMMFDSISRDFGIGLDLGEDAAGNILLNPSQKSVSSIADRIYRNAKEKGGLDPNLLKDPIRGSFIFKDKNQVDNVPSIIAKIKKGLIKIDVKDKPDYKGIHLNLKTEKGINVEIQLHDQKSWDLKKKSDTYYEKYRGVDIEKLSKDERKEYDAKGQAFALAWGKEASEDELFMSLRSLVSEEAKSFKALTASSSESKVSVPSSLGSTSNPSNEPLTGPQAPSENSLSEPSPNLTNRPVQVSTNRVLEPISDTSANSLPQNGKKSNMLENTFEQSNNGEGENNDIQRILGRNSKGSEGESGVIRNLSRGKWKRADESRRPISEISKKLLREEYATGESGGRLDLIVDSDGNEYLVNAPNATYKAIKNLMETIDPEVRQKLSEHSLEDFQKAKFTLVSPDGKSSISVLSDGDIINVINVGTTKGFVDKAMALAIDNGGIKLDCYNIVGEGVNLPMLYSKYGFIPTSSTPFDPSFIDSRIKDSFTAKNNGEPIVFMKYSGEYKAMFDSLEEIQRYIHDSAACPSGDWDASSAIRDKWTVDTYKKWKADNSNASKQTVLQSAISSVDFEKVGQDTSAIKALLVKSGYDVDKQLSSDYVPAYVAKRAKPKFPYTKYEENADQYSGDMPVDSTILAGIVAKYSSDLATEPEDGSAEAFNAYRTLANGNLIPTLIDDLDSMRSELETLSYEGNISDADLARATSAYLYLEGEENNYPFDDFLENASAYYDSTSGSMDAWHEDLSNAVDDFKSAFMDYAESLADNKTDSTGAPAETAPSNNEVKTSEPQADNPPYSGKVARNIRQNAELIKDSAQGNKELSYTLKSSIDAGKNVIAELEKIIGADETNGTAIDGKELFAALNLGNERDVKLAVDRIVDKAISRSAVFDGGTAMEMVDDASEHVAEPQIKVLKEAAYDVISSAGKETEKAKFEKSMNRLKDMMSTLLDRTKVVSHIRDKAVSLKNKFDKTRQYLQGYSDIDASIADFYHEFVKGFRISHSGLTVSPNYIKNTIIPMASRYTSENYVGSVIGLNQSIKNDLDYFSQKYASGIDVNKELSVEDMSHVRSIMDSIAHDLNEQSLAKHDAQVAKAKDGVMAARYTRNARVGKHAGVITSYKDSSMNIPTFIATYLGKEHPLYEASTHGWQKAENSKLRNKHEMESFVNSISERYGFSDRKIGKSLGAALSKQVNFKGIKMTKSQAAAIIFTMETRPEIVGNNKISLVSGREKVSTMFPLQQGDKERLEKLLTEDELACTKAIVKEFLNGNGTSRYIKWYKDTFGVTPEIEDNYFGTQTDGSQIQMNEGAISGRNYISGASWGRTKARVEHGKPMKIIGFTEQIDQYIDDLSFREGYTSFLDDVRIQLNVKIDGESLDQIMSETCPDWNSGVNWRNYMTHVLLDDMSFSKGGKLTSITNNLQASVLSLNIGSQLRQLLSSFTVMGESGVSTYMRSIPRMGYNLLHAKSVAEKIKRLVPIFKERVENHGLAKGKLSTETLNMFHKIGLLGMEKLDELNNVVSVWAVAETIAKEEGFALGSEASDSRSAEIFTDLLLMTQSNNNSMYTSPLRSRYLGDLKRMAWGLFGSDNQNKAQQVNQSTFEEANAGKRASEYEKTMNDENASQEDRDFAKSQKAKWDKSYSKKAYSKKTAGTIAGLILSGLGAAGIKEFMDRVYGKKDWDESVDAAEFAKDASLEAFVNWIPYLGTIANSVENNSDVSVFTLDRINNFVDSVKSIISSGGDEAKLRAAINVFARDMAEFLGIPANNVYKLIKGIIKSIDEGTYMSMYGWLENLSAKSITASYKSSVDDGNLTDAVSDLGTLYSMYKIGNASRNQLMEISRLSIAGYSNAVAKNVPTYYTDEDGNTVYLTSEETAAFRAFYSKSASAVDKVISSSVYQKMGDDAKAKIIKKAYDAFYEAAKYKAVGIEPTSQLGRLLAYAGGDFDIAMNLLLIQQASELSDTKYMTKKQQTLKLVNSAGMSRGGKLLALSLMGYKPSEENEPALRNYLISLGFTKSEAADFMS